jgi:DegV family protein with EDD domain
VIAAAKAAREGKTLADVAELARQMIKRMHFYFVPATLEYLKKGGRIGGAAALIGSVLNIKPILYVNQGTVAVWEKVRGFRSATERLLRLIEQESQARGITEIVVHHINVPERASELAHNLSQRYGLAVPVVPIGPVIGLHVGPGAIGFVFCTERAE